MVQVRGEGFSGSTPLISPWPAPPGRLRPDRSPRSDSPAPACGRSSPVPARPTRWPPWCIYTRGNIGSLPSRRYPVAGPLTRGNDSTDRRAGELHSRLLVVVVVTWGGGRGGKGQKKDVRFSVWSENLWKCHLGHKSRFDSVVNELCLMVLSAASPSEQLPVPPVPGW